MKSNFKIERVKSRKHLDYIKSFPCSITKWGLNCSGFPTDPHHLMKMGGRGAGMKEVDMWTVPLCRNHHNEVTGYGDEEVFWKYHDCSYGLVVNKAQEFALSSPDPKIRKAAKEYLITQQGE